MTDPESPLPLPKGGYNIDWDNFDENINPFETKPKVTNVVNDKMDTSKETDSETNSFQSKNKMAASPPQSPVLRTDDVDPFQSKDKMATSPIPGKDLQDEADINQNTEAAPLDEKLDEPREGEPESIGIPTSPTSVKSPLRRKSSGGKKGHIRFNVPPTSSQSESNIESFTSPPPPTDRQTSNSDSEEQFSDALPPPATDDSHIVTPPNLNGTEEEYKDAAEVFSDPADWDMLEKFGGKNDSFTESALTRQSLYVKFDPLVKGQSPEQPKPPKGVLNDIESEDTLLLMGTPPPKERGLRHPATRLLEAQITKETKDATSVLSSPADKKESIDNFLSCSPEATGDMMTSSMIGSAEMMESREQVIKPMMNSSWLETIKNYSELEGDSAIFSQDSVECVNWITQDTGRAESPLRFDHEEVLRIDSSIETDSGKHNINSASQQKDSLGTSTDSLDIVQVLKYSQHDYNRMKRELELHYQSQFLAKERDWQKEKENMENEAMRTHKNGEQSYQKLQKRSEQMETLVAEYEITMAQLIADKEAATSETKDSVSDLIRERDQALEDVNSVENAFSDLHRRYATLKEAVDGFKRNEKVLKKTLQDYQEKLIKQEEKYQTLKRQAEDKLEEANQEVEKITASSQSELKRMKAALKRAELQIQSCEQQYEQKVKENQELTAICDELINSKDSVP